MPQTMSLRTWLRSRINRVFHRQHPAIRQAVDQTRLAFFRERFKQEAAIGRDLFGPLPDGTIREFFCLDAHTWIWHEQWNDDDGSHSVTTRYSVRPDGIYKYQHSAEPVLLSGEEIRHFHACATAYCQRVAALHQDRTEGAAPAAA